jgi:hypothetical protein
MPTSNPKTGATTPVAVTTKFQSERYRAMREESLRNLERRARDQRSEARVEEEFLAAQRLQRALDEENPPQIEKPKRITLPLRDLFFSPTSRAGEILHGLQHLRSSHANGNSNEENR